MSSSPHKPLTSAQNFSSATKDSKSIRAVLRQELRNRVQYNDARVLQRLRTHEIDDDFVSWCLASFNADPGVQSSVRHLQELERIAETSERRDSPDQRKKQELAMYHHLQVIFDFIQSFPRPYHAAITTPRRFLRVDTVRSPIQHYTLGFPNTRPDFSLMAPGANGDSTDWGDHDGFAEIKATSKQGPHPPNSRDETIQEIVYQSADFARLHLSSRPFMLYSVGLMIYGSRFSVGIFDRDGVSISPEGGMWTDTEYFIRLVCSLTWNVTPTELGEDPTARKCDRRLMDTLGLHGEDFPSFIIEPITPGGDYWCTIGEPMWSSLSLLGRGTIIWCVRRYDPKDKCLLGPEMVMKTSWRQSGRNSESSIYRAVRGTSHPALAEFLTGGDVIDPRHDLLDYIPAQHIITAHYLRNNLTPVDNDQSPVLHRLVLKTIGRSIWTYTSDLELLRGMLAAVQAHQFLFEQGILHRDISAGNILLAKDPRIVQPGREGFLSDVEFALVECEHRFELEMSQAEAIRNLRDVSGDEVTGSTAKRGATMTGTVQFMAIEILEAIVEDRPIEHNVEHDIESFIWVLAYAVMRKVLKVTEAPETAKHSARKRLDDDFKRSFGSLSVADIASSRTSLWPLEFIIRKTEDFFFPYLSRPLRDVLFRLRAGLRSRIEAPGFQKVTTLFDDDESQTPETVALTHAWLIKYFNGAIRALESDPSLQR